MGLNPISLGIMVDRNKGVPSCTIEEYEILKYIGNKLGQEGMPPIHYPKALTKEGHQSLLILNGQNIIG